MTKMKYAAILLALLAAFSAACAMATGGPEPERGVYVNVTYKDDDTPLAGARFDLFLLAQQDAEGRWQPTEDFALYDLGLDDSAQWSSLAPTLEGYALRDALTPIQSGTTNENGFLRLPNGGGKLPHGLYLIIGHTHTQNNTKYYALPAVVQLPRLSTDRTVWLYEIDVLPKYEFDPIPPEPVYTERKVLKVWEDEGHEDQRPAEIVVQLLRDGTIHQTVTLNAENLWRWTWENLEANHRWMVVEQDVEGYASIVTQTGITFVITNTYQEPEATPTPTPTPTPDPDATPTPTPDPEATPTPTPTPTPTHAPTPTPTPRPPHTLPQTGQLWWPVPVLLWCGLVLIILGLVRRRSEDYER